MDGQNQVPNVNGQPVHPQAVAPPPTVAVSPTPQAAKPELNLSDKEAQALLAINNIGAGQHTKHKLPVGMIITILVLIALVIVSSNLIGGLKNKKTAVTTNSTSKSSSHQTNSSTGQGVDNQVNNDVNSCSNVVNALTEC